MGATELELMHRARAARYADAETRAVAADERIKELATSLEDAEWRARAAEDQVAAVEYDPMLGKVWTAGMDAPTQEEALALLDLATGTVLLRERWAQGSYGVNWMKAGRATNGQTRYEWPIPDGYGPFIAWRDEWAFDAVLKATAEQDEREETLRRFIYGKDGYSPDGASVWTRPDLADAYKRVVIELEKKHLDRLSEVRAFEDRLASMYYVCLTCGAQYLRADGLDHADDCNESDIVRFERVSS